MRFLVRRVSAASVEVAGSVVGKINQGMTVYLGFENNDEIIDLEWGIKKIIGLRIFDDSEGKMNLPVNEKMGILIISQFTLFGNSKKAIDLRLIGQLIRIWHASFMINSSRF